MSEANKLRRAYRSDTRREGAERTRQRIQDAAERCFLERGFAATTVTAIAEAAGTAAETVYAAFGTKAHLLETVVRRAARGPSETEVLDQPTARAVREAPDRKTALCLFAGDISRRLERVGPLLALLAAAAPGDPALASLYKELHASRQRNLRALTESLTRLGPLQHSEPETTETIWALASPELYLLLTSVQGWTRARYAAWLESSLAALV
jgi:AcrR family transcriptional regulator